MQLRLLQGVAAIRAPGRLLRPALNLLKRKGCLLLDFLRHAGNAARVALDIFELGASPDGVQRAKSLPDVLFVNRDIGQGFSWLRLRAVAYAEGADLAR